MPSTSPIYRLVLGATIGTAVLFAAAPGCETTTPAATRATLTCKMPVITPQPETKESQEKGGIEISVAPVTYTAKLEERVRVQQVPPPIVSLHMQSGIYAERSITPTLTVAPDHLHFLVKVNNKLARVFHGAGTVVQFNVGGRLQAVDQGGYNNFLGAIIPPRQEQQIEIIGPALSSLTADKGIIGVFLYDVVTNQNVAGMVTEKQNFEWYFDYTLQTETRTAAPTREAHWMSPTEFYQATSQQALEDAHIPAQSGRR